MLDFSFNIIVIQLLIATLWTIALSCVAFVGGGVCGLVILLARVSHHFILRWSARLFIDVFQGTPLLMQLFLLFFGIALFGIKTSPWMAASLALTLWTAAYLAEIWRGCVDAIPRGQWEASASLGLGFADQMRFVIVPQALRIALAPTVGFSVQVIKATALTSVIGFLELTKAGTVLNNATFRPFLIYSLVAAIYFCLCFPLSLMSKKLERRFHAAR
jgi:polar amino acid transport system permease protein